MAQDSNGATHEKSLLASLRGSTWSYDVVPGGGINWQQQGGMQSTPKTECTGEGDGALGPFLFGYFIFGAAKIK